MFGVVFLLCAVIIISVSVFVPILHPVSQPYAHDVSVRTTRALIELFTVSESQI